MRVLGLGVGRTGTLSLKLALERLGFGPCHHMERVMQAMPVQVPLWVAALDGQPDWPTIYSGFDSAVDWPTAGFTQELVAAYPDARFILTHRSPESWVASFSETIQQAVTMKDGAPSEVHAWLDMAERVVARTGFPPGMDREGLKKAFVAHNNMVKTAVPADRLLVYEVKEGWGPLCGFLDVPVPGEDFPRTNNREEFWELVKGGSAC